MFIERLAQYFPSLKVIIPPDGMKDPADMSVKIGDRLSDELHDLLDTAEQSEVGTTYYRGANFTDIRQAVAAAYQHGGNDDAATKVQGASYGVGAIGTNAAR